MSPAEKAQLDKHAAKTKKLHARANELSRGSAIDQQVALKLFALVEKRSSAQIRALLKLSPALADLEVISLKDRP